MESVKGDGGSEGKKEEGNKIGYSLVVIRELASGGGLTERRVGDSRHGDPCTNSRLVQGSDISDCHPDELNKPQFF